MTLDTENLTLIVTIATLFSVLIGPVITGLITAWQAGKDREEARRKEAEANAEEKRQARIEHLQQSLTHVIGLTGKRESISPQNVRKVEIELTAILRSLPYQDIRECVKITDGAKTIPEMSNAINKAVEFIGDHIWEEMNK